MATDLEARKQRLDKRADAMKKARARLRKNQRQEQARRLRELGEVIEATAGRRVSPDEARAMARWLGEQRAPAAYETPLPPLD